MNISDLKTRYPKIAELDRRANKVAMRKLASSKRFTIYLFDLKMEEQDYVNYSSYDISPRNHDPHQLRTLSEISSILKQAFIRIARQIRSDGDEVYVEFTKSMSKLTNYFAKAAPSFEFRNTPHSQVMVMGKIRTKRRVLCTYRYVISGLNLDDSSLKQVLDLGLKKVHFSD